MKAVFQFAVFAGSTTLQLNDDDCTFAHFSPDIMISWYFLILKCYPPHKLFDIYQ